MKYFSDKKFEHGSCNEALKTNKEKIRIYNINDKDIIQDKESFINDIAVGLQQSWSTHVNWGADVWREIVKKRIKTQSMRLPFTLVAIQENAGNNKLLGAISAALGCEEAYDSSSIWLCGLYVEPTFRRNGLALCLGEQMLEQLKKMSIYSFKIYTVVPELDHLYANLGIEKTDEIVVEGYPANIRNGDVTKVLNNIHKELVKEKYVTQNALIPELPVKLCCKL